MSAYWQIVVLIIHISKIIANDMVMSLRHYDVVSFLEYTLPYTIGSQVFYVDVNN